MWRILRLLFLGKWEYPQKEIPCDHRFVTIDTKQTNTYSRDYNGKKTEFPTQRVVTYIQQCSCCGKMNHYQVEL